MTRNTVGTVRMMWVGVWLALVAPTWAAAQSTVDLGRMTIEELFELKVTTVSRKPQSVASAAAALFVLTDDDIRRSGLSSLPEVLRLVPGVQVSRYSNGKWAISARGMGSYYSNKLLVLIDGRSVYTPDFAGVYWDVHEVPLGDIERIEVVRGPGGVMWGANAVNGVINVITKLAAGTPGALVSVTAGSNDRIGSFRYGGAFGTGSAYRVYGKISDRDSDTVAPLADNLRIARAGFRVDDQRADGALWTIQADAYTGVEHGPLTLPALRAPYSVVVADRIDIAGASVLGRWARPLSTRSDVALQFYFDRNRRDEYIHPALVSTVDLDFQHRLRVNTRNDVIWGVDYRFTRTTIRNTVPVMNYTPGRTTRHLFSAFAQDEIALTPHASLVVGTKVEHHETVGLAIEPSVRASWRPATGHNLWAAVSRGVRTPSLADQIATFAYGVLPPSAATSGLPVEILVAGDPKQTHMEAVVAYEAGYRAQLSTTVAIDVTAFRNQYDHLTSYSRGPIGFSTAGGVPHLSLTSTHDNLAAGESHGLETLVTWTPLDRLSITGWATLFTTNLHMTDLTVDAGNTFLVLKLTPSEQVGLRTAFQILPSVDVDASVWWNGPWQMGNVDGYTRVDLRTGWKGGRSISVDVGVQNLLNARHRETTTYLFETATEIPRAAYARVTWGF